jgi:hypothetical protein
LPAVSETDSAIAIGTTSTVSMSTLGASPAAIWSAAPTAARTPTIRTEGRRRRPASTAPATPPTASAVETVPKAPLPRCSGPVTSTASVSV